MDKLILLPLFIPIIVILLFTSVFPYRESGYLHIHFYDIGQGDGMLIRTGENKRIVIDGGPSPQLIADYIQKDLGYFENTIDLMILTHPDSDHLTGLSEVLRRFRVKVLLVNYVDDNSLLDDLLTTAQEVQTEVRIASPQEDIVIDQYTVIDIVSPSESIGDSATEDNDRSIIFRLLFGEHTFLFSGDAEKTQEQRVLEEGHVLTAEYLKGGHHGSNTSSTQGFLDAVKPSTVIFQNGKNNTYGHPSQAVLQRIESMGSEIYNTSLSGTISMKCPIKEPCIIEQEYE